MRFLKMHGAGNDFVMVDGTRLPQEHPGKETISDLCNRRTGIGADGVIVLDPAATAEADFRMTYYNADGTEAEMCGNGARCSVAYASLLGWISSSCHFVTASGILSGRILESATGRYEVEVSLPSWRDLRTDLAISGSPWTEHHFCNTGVPHVVIPVDQIEDLDVARYGAHIRHHDDFAPAGTNVNWIAPSTEVTSDGRPVYGIRTFERGVEAETLACGTGASATAVVMCHLGQAESPVVLRTRNGDLLRISVDPAKNELLLRGPAVVSFQGEIG